MRDASERLRSSLCSEAGGSLAVGAVQTAEHAARDSARVGGGRDAERAAALLALRALNVS